MFGFIFSIGVIKSNPNFSPTVLNACLLNAENLPLQGTIAPSKIDLDYQELLEQDQTPF